MGRTPCHKLLIEKERSCQRTVKMLIDKWVSDLKDINIMLGCGKKDYEIGEYINRRIDALRGDLAK